jgi:hypothetical protein
MVLPFEVPYPHAWLCSSLLVFKRLGHIYRYPNLMHIIFSFISGELFSCLDEAISAAISFASGTEREALVWVLRNVTLPEPVSSKQLRYHTGCVFYWCRVPSGCSVTLASKGGSWRIRNAITQKPCSLFLIEDDAKMHVKGVTFFPSNITHPQHEAKMVLATVLGHGAWSKDEDVCIQGYDVECLPWVNFPCNLIFYSV